MQGSFRWWRWAGMGVAVALLVLGVARITAKPSSSAPSGDSSVVGLTSYPPGSGPRLPAISGTGLNGERLDLADAAGHVTVINLWGSWCAPCRAEAPGLVRVANETKGLGVRFFGIDTRDDPAAARAFVRRFHVPYPSFDDRNARVIGRFTGIVPISAVPSTVVVDAQQRVAARVVGRVDERTLRGLIADVAGKPSAARVPGQVAP